MFFVGFLYGCSDKENKNVISDTQTLARVVYEATTSGSNDINLNIEKYRLTHDFYYKEFRIYDSFGFTATLDFTLSPYLENQEVGEEVFVIIALLEFTASTFEEDTMLQKMIIFEHEDQICGFMSTSMKRLDSLNGYNFNCAYPGVQDKKINYHFSSCMVLTEEAIVKYYEPTDTLYDFNYSEYLDGNVEFSAEVGPAFEEKTNYDIQIKEDSFVKLNKDIVVDLINSCLVEKVVFVAIITEIDEENGTIYVRSDEYPTLRSVNYRFAIIDSTGFINFMDLKTGDEISLYFYKRHSEYKPVDITVDNIYMVL